MKLKLLPWLMFLFLAALIALAQESPPSLSNFHQLYGEVSSLPAGTFTLKASVGGNNFTAPIDTQGKYGYSPTFKVYGQDGQSISFTLVSSLGLSTALETTTAFQSRAISLINLRYPGAGEEPAAEVHGCMNQTATNYNANATTDDGSCLFAAVAPAGEMEGCKHANATNYNASVTEDDESCIFPSGIVVGCLNASAFNYNASATIQYGRCIFRRGCTNETAVNYNASAMINDGSCRFNVTTVLSACLMSWECSAWSTCLNERQTRSCLRTDNCDAQAARGNVTLTTVPKPEESKYCPTATETARVCTPDSKRCSGVNLEQCSFDGRAWNLMQSCPLGCNSITLQCREETLPPPTVTKQEREPFPAWVIYLFAALVLVGAIGAGVFFVLQQRKYAPLKKYIGESRSEGFPDRQIRSRLIAQGWDPEKVDKLLK